jgi:integrase
MRVCELKKLRWDSVDFPNNRVVVTSPKSMHARYAPLGPKTYQILKAYHDRKPDSEFVFGEAPESLFIRASRQLRVVGDQIGTGQVSFRALRHTFAERLVSTGAWIDACMFVLGYSSPNTAMARKWQPTPEQYYAQAAPHLAKLEEL